MKILIVHCGKGIYGGAELVIVELANYLYKQEHEVTMVAKDVPKDFYGGIHPVIPCYQPDTYLSLRGTVQTLLSEMDVVNVHNFPATLAPFPTKKPIVWMCNEPAELFTNWWRKPIEAFNRWWVKKSGMKVVVADDFNMRRFRNIYGVEPKIIPYGVDYAFWSKGVSFTKEPGVTRMLQVGTVTPYKNQLKSITMLAELLSEGMDVTLTLAGGFTDMEYYNKLVNDYIPIANEEIPGITDRIQFLGQISREEVRDLYQNHDLLFHPVEGQGGWLVPFEAMCADLPVIVEPEFSASSLIQSNHLGIVSGNRGMIAAQAILNKEYEKLDTEKVKKWVKENLSWEKFGEGMLRAFEEAING